MLEVTLMCTGESRSEIFFVHVDTTVSSSPPSVLNRRVADMPGMGGMGLAKVKPVLGALVAQRLALARAGRAAWRSSRRDSVDAMRTSKMQRRARDRTIGR